MGMQRQQPACHSGTVEDNKDVNDIRMKKLSHTVDAVLLSYFFCRIQKEEESRSKKGEKGKRKGGKEKYSGLLPPCY